MSRAWTLLVLGFLVWPPGISAQAPGAPPEPTSKPAPAPPAPLTTGTRPDDIPTTTPETVQPGMDGDAPVESRGEALRPLSDEERTRRRALTAPAARDQVPPPATTPATPPAPPPAQPPAQPPSVNRPVPSDRR